MCSFTSLAKEKKNIHEILYFTEAGISFEISGLSFCSLEALFSLKNYYMIIIIYQKIHFEWHFQECSLIKLQIFKCIWDINTDQELSGLFVCSETGKSFSSLLCRGWIFTNGMSWHSQCSFPCSFALFNPRGMIAALAGVFQHWWGFQDALLPFPARVKQQQLPIKFVIGF